MWRIIVLLTFSLNFLVIYSAEHKVTPGNYQNFIKKLQPGDVMSFAEGDYKNNLLLEDVHGTEDAPIILQGVEGKTVFLANSNENTINFINCSYIVFKNFKLDGQHVQVDAIKMKQGGFNHHLTIENNIIVNYDVDQQENGISSKGTAWNISIIGNVIDGAGTGLYLGNSDGSAPFIGGLIEKNLVMNTIGYNMEIKHQKSRSDAAEVPANAKTIIRYNVFCKQKKGKGKPNGIRPNVLVGHFPLTGKGKDDEYIIYNNFFYENIDGEALFQGEGNIAFYNNVLSNSKGGGVRIQKHNDKPRNIKVFFNTIVAKNDGLRVSSGDTGFSQIALGNLVFSDTAISAPENKGNMKLSYDNAKENLLKPFDEIGTLNLFPQSNKAKADKLEFEAYAKYPDASYDFNGLVRTGLYRGAFEGNGLPYKWLPLLKRMRMDYYNELAGTNKRLNFLVNQIKSGTPLTNVMIELERLAPTDTSAADILREITNEGLKDLERADELKPTDANESLNIYDRVARRFGQHEIGKRARESTKDIRDKVMRERAIAQIKEKNATVFYQRVQVAVDSLQPYKGKKELSDENFQKINGRSIEQIKKACEAMIKNYPGTSATLKAQELLSQFTKEAND